MHITTISLFAGGIISSVSAHGVMTSPTPRAVGNAIAAACGSSVAAIIKGDPTSHVEGLPEAAATDPNFDASKCNLFLCKGLQFADNTANVLALTPGQSLNLKFDITIPHEGPANVSVVDTKTNKLIGAPLISFTTYADEALPVLPKNNTDMTVTVPTTLGSKCAVAGDCVIQWFWFGTGADQTYESCLDFTMAGTSSGSGAAVESVTKAASTSASESKTVSTSVAALAESSTSVSKTKSHSTSASALAESTTTAVQGFSTVTDAFVSVSKAAEAESTTAGATASVTGVQSVFKNSTTAAETSIKSTTKSASKTASAGAVSTGNTTAPISANAGNTLKSSFFASGNILVVAAFVLAARAF